MTEFKKVFLDTAPLIYFLDADIKLGEKVKNIFEETFPGIDIIINKLPAVLTCHGGLGCIAVHYVHKME